MFMPCTPNPTTGFFFYVLRREIIELDIPVEAAAELLMSAGMMQPGGNGDSRSGSRRWPRPRGLRAPRKPAHDRAGELTAGGLILQRGITMLPSCQFGRESTYEFRPGDYFRLQEIRGLYRASATLGILVLDALLLSRAVRGGDRRWRDGIGRVSCPEHCRLWRFFCPVWRFRRGGCMISTGPLGGFCCSLRVSESFSWLSGIACEERGVPTGSVDPLAGVP